MTVISKLTINVDLDVAYQYLARAEHLNPKLRMPDVSVDIFVSTSSLCCVNL